MLNQYGKVNSKTFCLWSKSRQIFSQYKVTTDNNTVAVEEFLNKTVNLIGPLYWLIYVKCKLRCCSLTFEVEVYCFCGYRHMIPINYTFCCQNKPHNDSFYQLIDSLNLVLSYCYSFYYIVFRMILFNSK